MDEPSKRRKWRRWLERIAREVERLQREHQLYAEVRNALSCKPQWVHWIDTLYLMGVSLAIRRLADANPRHRTVSLVKLLQEMEAHTDCLSRRSALQQAAADRRERVHQLFDQLAAEGALFVPPEVLCQLRQEFAQRATPFRAWVDHCVAHHDLSATSAPPEQEQVEEALAHLQRVLEALHLLLGGGHRAD